MAVFNSIKNSSGSLTKRKSFFKTLLGISLSNVPENTVYGEPKSPNLNKRMTLTNLRHKYKKGEPITMVTAEPMIIHLESILTLLALIFVWWVTLLQWWFMAMTPPCLLLLMKCLCIAVLWLEVPRALLLVGDLPFGTYESSTLQAVSTAVRVLNEGGMDAIKLEGGAPSRITAAKAMVEAGIAVMGHVGLTPQAISVLGGGFRPQGRNVASAVRVVETAIALQKAGCFAVVLECVPPPVAAAATSALQIPTIGIGAGPSCSGQGPPFLLIRERKTYFAESSGDKYNMNSHGRVLVYHDLLGMLQHPHHAKVTPKFCKQYAHIGEVVNKALLRYKEELTNGSFPSSVHSPYKISAAELDSFSSELQKLGSSDAASAANVSAEKIETTESTGGR